MFHNLPLSDLLMAVRAGEMGKGRGKQDSGINTLNLKQMLRIEIEI